MALKDWKKIETLKDSSIRKVTGYKKDGETILLISHLKGKRDKPYEFRPGLISKHKSFKTKKQLLTYARVYMRKY